MPGIELERAVVVLTGGSSGIGLATARLLARRARRLIVHGVDAAAPAALLREPATDYLSGDFRELASVARVAQSVAALTDRVDVLVNNAGIPGPPRRSLTTDGHEVTYQVNVLAGAMLASLLTPLIPAGGRIVNVASATHYSASLDPGDPEGVHGPHSPVRAYAHSKLAIVTYSVWLARELAPAAVDVVSVHPGVIDTNLLHAMFGAVGAPAEQAASVLLELSRRPLVSGAYYDELVPSAPNPEAVDRAAQARVARYIQAAFDLSGRRTNRKHDLSSEL